MRRAIACLAGLAIATAALTPATALADGDPASDELIGANVFYPFSPPVAADLQKTLNSETAAAHAVHFPIKVALIASPADLGAIPSLFAKPQQYADFLEQEISYLDIRQLVLVVMPNGYGFYRTRGASTSEQSALSRLAPPGRTLVASALSAIQRLAAASGHRLPTPTATTPSKRSSTDTLAWIVFAIGTVLIVLAWTASLRARPARLFSGRASGG